MRPIFVSAVIAAAVAGLAACGFETSGALADTPQEEPVSRSVESASAEAAPVCGGEARPTGPGTQKLALLMAVDAYPQDPEWTLDGPVNDLETFRDLIGAYGYEPENICTLTDADVTLENVASAFRHIADRADAEDQVTVFFAGHGTQIPSVDGDEYPNDLDQALVLYDSDMPLEDGSYQPYLIDDDLAGLLSLVRAKTGNVTVVLDSCHSGSATRGLEAADLTGARTLPRLSVETAGRRYASSRPILEAAGASRVTGFDDEWSSVAPDGTVVLAAARDGTLAYESGGNGAFTSALVRAVSQMKGRPMTLAMLDQKLRSDFAGTLQTPLVHGDSRSFLFSTDRQPPVLALRVKEADETSAVLTGLRLSTTGVGAELRIYDGAAKRNEFDDPSKAKATATVIGLDGPNVEVELTGTTASVGQGDLAVEVVPALAAQLFDVDVSALSADERSGLETALADLGSGGALVNPVSANAAFSVTRDGDTYVARGGDGRIRNRLDDLESAARRLSYHARQWSLLQLGGEGAGVFADNRTLKVSVIRPSEDQIPNASFCRPKFMRSQMARFAERQEQEAFIPMCAYFAVEVSAEIAPADPTEISIGAFILGHGGDILALGQNESIILSKDKTSHRFEGWDVFQAFVERDALTGDGPDRIEEQIIVFGVDADESIPWDLFGTEQMGRGVRAGRDPRALSTQNPLFHQLERYVERTRSPKRIAAAAVQAKPWTVSTLPVSIGVNPAAAREIAAGEAQRSREYTVNDFDLTPYRPVDDTSALYKVMDQMEALTTASEGVSDGDGYPYSQHNWCEGSDQANLEKGIDCSRSIWYAFTRAGLPYTSPDNLTADRSVCQPFGGDGNGYLVTSAMVGETSGMSEYFDDCMQDRPFRTGDILVYRDEDRGVGHTVMVIDAEERIAWGSHGWDGNDLLGKTADNGVEFQKILRKPDWGAWDRSTMSLQACWRYREFRSGPVQDISWYDGVMCDGEEGGLCPREAP